MQMQASVTVSGNMSVAELKKALDKVPDDAKISISTYQADRPGELSYSTITFRWSV